MPFGQVDWIALIAAFVASYAFSAAYYITLSKPWMAAIGKTEAEVQAGAGPVAYVVAILGQLIIAYVLMNLMISLGMVSLGGGVTLAVTLWIGFVATTMLINHRFQGASWSHSIIDGAHWLAILLIQGIVIGLLAG
ncbi:MAG: DUF1761 domain-containing protein [Alphaproteobacteria bacterium]|jgi:hypothetical protein|nr:DUF1761 domain-containing protein [Alphaproteobacteria bacterium]